MINSLIKFYTFLALFLFLVVSLSFGCSVCLIALKVAFFSLYSIEKVNCHIIVQIVCRNSDYATEIPANSSVKWLEQ